MVLEETHTIEIKVKSRDNADFLRGKYTWDEEIIEYKITKHKTSFVINEGPKARSNNTGSNFILLHLYIRRKLSVI